MLGLPVYIAAVVAVLAFNAHANRTTPAAIARRIRSHPSSLLTAAAFGALVGLGFWGADMLFNALVWPTRRDTAGLVITSASWTILSLIWDTARARRRAERQRQRKEHRIRMDAQAEAQGGYLPEWEKRDAGW